MPDSKAESGILFFASTMNMIIICKPHKKTTQSPKGEWFFYQMYVSTVSNRKKIRLNLKHFLL